MPLFSRYHVPPFKRFPMPTCHISNTFLYYLSHVFFSKLKRWNVNSYGKRSHKPMRPLISALSPANSTDGSSFEVKIIDGSNFEASNKRWFEFRSRRVKKRRSDFFLVRQTNHLLVNSSKDEPSVGK
ncbi:hypothetical protein HMPREF1248_0923 [Coriobacteriaceae bacterium BV3Ac1]|nr:hypothetical protein HMPREF1248_0923 [Coriobacteriaceae bacterium BV3Ac1]